MQSSKKLLWFTLVELIVVITIVGILSTIGFVSYSGYLTGARDSSRLSQLTKLTDGLHVYSTSKRLPLPDDYVSITASGALIAYQWAAWVDVLDTIDYGNGGRDPKDNTYFTYYLDKDRNTFQLLALLEEVPTASIIPQSYAADYTNRFIKVYGKKLWVLTTATTNVPIQEVTGVTTLDIVSTTDIYVANITNTEALEWNGTVLRRSIANSSCKRIKEVWKAKGNGIYTINPAGLGEMSAYCEMENAWGGWTLVGRSESGSSGSIWWGTSAWAVNIDTAHYSMWSRVTGIDFTEIMVGRYSINKIIDYAVKFTASSDDLDTSSSTTVATADCESVMDRGLTTAEKAWSHCTPFTYWWDANNTTNFFFRNSGTASATWWVLPWSLSASSYGSSYWAWHGKQWMVFIR